MTLLPVRNALVSVFTQKDHFAPSDFATIELPEHLEGHREPLIRSVLADLTEAGMLRGLCKDGEKEPSIWVLTSPLGGAGQQLDISLPTASAVAREIEAFMEAFKDEVDDWPEPDALSIGEHNILMLMAIIARLRGQDPDDLDGEEDET